MNLGLVSNRNTHFSMRMDNPLDGPRVGSLVLKVLIIVVLELDGFSLGISSRLTTYVPSSLTSSISLLRGQAYPLVNLSDYYPVPLGFNGFNP
jgi:hypothetical protein